MLVPTMFPVSAGPAPPWMSRKTGKLGRRGGRLAGGPGYHLFAGRSREDVHAPYLAERRHVLAHRLLVEGVHDEVESVAAVNDALSVDLDPERLGAGLRDVLSQHGGDLRIPGGARLRRVLVLDDEQRHEKSSLPHRWGPAFKASARDLSTGG